MNKELANDLNVYLANIGVSYIKLHNLHWNVVGGQFKAVHEYLETVYDAYADVLDEVAELLKMQEAYPVAGMADMLRIATVKELESKDVAVQDSLRILLDDLKLLQAQAADIRKRADAEDNFAVVGMMEDHLGGYAKNVWFVASMLK